MVVAGMFLENVNHNCFHSLPHDRKMENFPQRSHGPVHVEISCRTDRVSAND